jgi:isoleucyl-tRNA synthetase
VCSAALSLREERGLRARLPLASLTVAGEGAERVVPLADLVRDEVNVKDVRVAGDVGAFGEFVLRPDGRVLGPRLGGDTQKVMKAARAGDWEANGDGTVTVAGVTLEPDSFELTLRPNEGEAIAALRGARTVVALDTDVTPALHAEGLARDLVRLVQQARKEQDLVVTDRIRLRVQAPAEVLDAVKPHEPYVADQVLATSVEYGDVSGSGAHDGSHHGTVDGHPVTFTITPV